MGRTSGGETPGIGKEKGSTERGLQLREDKPKQADRQHEPLCKSATNYSLLDDRGRQPFHCLC
jgi:hypothetical protein